MNLVKAAIGTAAVITCCLGNEMPAEACDWCVVTPSMSSPTFVRPSGNGGYNVIGPRGTTMVRPTPTGGARIHGPSGTTTINRSPLGGYTIY